MATETPIYKLPYITPQDPARKYPQRHNEQADKTEEALVKVVGDATAAGTAAAQAAAGPAVALELDAADVVMGDDYRALRVVTSQEYAVPITDQDGYVAGGVLADGVWNFEKPVLIQGVPGTTLQPVTTHQGWAIPFVDEDGYVAGGIRADGTAVFYKLASGMASVLQMANEAIGYTRSDKTKVATQGDSLTNGYFGGSSGHTADAYPAKLQTLLGAGVSVSNISTSGWCVDEVAARTGALKLPLTVSGGSIPASGSVNATTPVAVGWGGASRGINGTLAGVPGKLTSPPLASSTYTFARTTAGVAVPVPAGTVFVPDYAGHLGETNIIFLGRNDVSLNVTGSESSVSEHIAAGVSRIVDAMTTNVKQALIVSVTTTVSEERGTARYATVTEANRILAEKYPSRFLDLRGYLVTQAIYDLGLTPTATDLAKMAADTLPPSIMDPGADGTGDGTHYSKATAALVAQQVFNYLTTREWV